MNFNSILLFSENPKKLSEFYQKLADHEPVWSEGEYTGFQFGSGIITIGSHDKVKGPNKQPERIMINFEVPDVQKEFDRVVELGAKVIAKPYHPGEEPTMLLATLADPDGNIFQLMTPWEPKK